MIGFEQPAVFPFAVLLLAGLLLYRRIRRQSGSIPVPLGAPGGSVFVPPTGADALVRILSGLDAAGFLLLAVAAAGPVVLSSEQVWLKRGADVVFVVDASPSMTARDMDGDTRFDFAKSLVARFADDRGADAVGLVGVGAEAALLVPPTIDRSAFGARLAALVPGEFGDGTALGMGLSIAALHLRSSTAPKKAVVLLTDGENNAGAVHPTAAARVLQSLGVSLWVVGIGGAGEVALDYVDPNTGERRSGIFESRSDPAALKAVADAGGGDYLAAPDPKSFVRAFSRIDGAESVGVLSRSRVVSKPAHDPLLAIALIVLSLVRFVRRVVLGAWA